MSTESKEELGTGRIIVLRCGHPATILRVKCGNPQSNDLAKDSSHTAMGWLKFKGYRTQGHQTTSLSENDRDKVPLKAVSFWDLDLFLKSFHSREKNHYVLKYQHYAWERKFTIFFFSQLILERITSLQKTGWKETILQFNSRQETSIQKKKKIENYAMLDYHSCSPFKNTYEHLGKHMLQKPIRWSLCLEDFHSRRENRYPNKKL